MEKCVKPSKYDIVMFVLILGLVMNRGAAAAAEPPQSIITPNLSSSCFILCMIMCGIQGDIPPVCVVQCRAQCRDDSSSKPLADHNKVNITIDQVPCTVDCIKSMYPNLAPSDVVGKVEMSSIDSCSQKCSKTKH